MSGRMRHLPGPAAVPKSAATIVDGWIFTSGQVGQDLETGEFVEGLAAQVRLALRNLGDVLEQGGGGIDTIAKIQIFIARQEDVAGMNEIYREWVPEPRPARSTTVTELVHPALLFEIEAVAYVREGA